MCEFIFHFQWDKSQSHTHKLSAKHIQICMRSKERMALDSVRCMNEQEKCISKNEKAL